ncbi:uncharacterized protein GJ701_004240 [Geothlypis trichas]
MCASAGPVYAPRAPPAAARHGRERVRSTGRAERRRPPREERERKGERAPRCRRWPGPDAAGGREAGPGPARRRQRLRGRGRGRTGGSGEGRFWGPPRAPPPRDRCAAFPTRGSWGSRRLRSSAVPGAWRRARTADGGSRPARLPAKWRQRPDLGPPADAAARCSSARQLAVSAADGSPPARAPAAGAALGPPGVWEGPALPRTRPCRERLGTEQGGSPRAMGFAAFAAFGANDEAKALLLPRKSVGLV